MTVTVDDVIKYATEKCNVIILHLNDGTWIEFNNVELSDKGELHISLNKHKYINKDDAWKFFINYYIKCLRDYKYNEIKNS